MMRLTVLVLIPLSQASSLLEMLFENRVHNVCNFQFGCPSLLKAPDQIDSFLHELEYFVEMTHVEQICQMSNHLPSVEEYQARRMGSSAVGVCLAITECDLLQS